MHPLRGRARALVVHLEGPAAVLRGATEEDEEVTERNLTGDASRSKYRRAQKVAAELGLTDEVLATLAEGVREFDQEQSSALRQTKALERIAQNTVQAREKDGHWAWETQRLRRREVVAQEFLALAMVADDADLTKLRQSPAYKKIFDRLTSDQPGSSVHDASA